MPMLGDLLAAARGRAADIEAILAQADPELAERFRRTAENEGLGASTFARAAVADFSRFASEEDWATLVSGMRDSADPGTACLAAMIHWRLTARACEAHSHG